MQRNSSRFYVAPVGSIHSQTMLLNSKLLIVLAGALFIACAGNEFKCTESGLYPLSLSNCKSFYVCSTVNGIDFVATEQNCDDGLLFDEIQEKCVPQSSYVCPAADPCQNQTGRFPIPNTNCSSYYFCMKKGNGTIRAIYRCPNGSKFSSFSRRCERAYECPEADATTTTTGNTVSSVGTTTTLQSNETATTISTGSGEAIVTTSEEKTLTTSSPTEVTNQKNSTTVEQSRPPLTPESPIETTIMGNPTTENSTPEASSTTTSSSTIIWQTSEITSTIPEQTSSQNNLTTTELPQTSTDTPSPNDNSTVTTNTGGPESTETISGIPNAPPDSLGCPVEYIMRTKTGNYRLAGEITSYVSCIRLDAMLFCGINKCDSGKVFCETSYRCIDRIWIHCVKSFGRKKRFQWNWINYHQLPSGPILI